MGSLSRATKGGPREASSFGSGQPKQRSELGKHMKTGCNTTHHYCSCFVSGFFGNACDFSGIRVTNTSVEGKFKRDRTQETTDAC
eukprot:548745-Amphidinium_carterae.1